MRSLPVPFMPIYKQFAILFLFVAVLLTACAEKPKSVNGKYSFYILGKNGKEYLMQSDNLSNGELKPEISGTELDGSEMDRDVFVKNGFYYHLNRKSPLFTKFKLEKGKFERVAAVKLENFSIENFNWISADTLLLTGLNVKGYNQPEYALISVGSMKLISRGFSGIPKPKGKFTSMSIGFLERNGDKLFVGYTYHVAVETSNYLTSDTMYFSTLTYPEMKLLKTEKDSRSTYPGGINTIQPYSFADFKGDHYFMSCPGIALGNRPEMPTAIFRIKAKENKVDRDYFFNISNSAIQNHAYGMWYLGGDEAIIRSERKDLFKGLGDHYSTAHFEFYILNLKTKSVKKLNLPLDKGTRKQCVIVEGNTAYIAVNSTKEGNNVWLYDIKAGTLKKGIRLSGDTDFILRMDKLRD